MNCTLVRQPKVSHGRFLATALCILICAAVFSQPITTPQAAVSNLTNRKINQLNLLIKLVPLVLKKSQFDALLGALAKARQIEEEQLEKEDKLLIDLDPSVTDAITNAVEKGIYPPREFQKVVADKERDAMNQRVLVQYKELKLVSDAINASLNDGQKKTMEGSYAASFINPANPASVTDDVKLEFYEREVFLDTDTYGLLQEMAKHAS
jgi:hypothetical protein